MRSVMAIMVYSTYANAATNAQLLRDEGNLGLAVDLNAHLAHAHDGAVLLALLHRPTEGD